VSSHSSEVRWEGVLITFRKVENMKSLRYCRSLRIYKHPEQQLLERVVTISFVLYPVGIVTHMGFVVWLLSVR